MAGTVIGEGLSIEGDVSSEEEVVVQGNLRGKLTTTDAVSVGSSAVIEADVSAQSLTIAGQVTGDVTAAERVDLQAGGRLIGDVKASRLTIADGASFKGNVDMDVETMNGSVIGRGTVVRGNVRGSGSLEIFGRVEGDVSVNGELVLGEESAVKGNVSGSHITVSGAVQGDVRGSEAVLLERGARVVGDLTAPRIGVATGALVKGLVRTDGEPPLAAARRPVAAVARPVAFAAARAPAPPKVEPREEPESEVPPPPKEQKAAREAPPPPVVPALAKGAKAKKKKRED